MTYRQYTRNRGDDETPEGTTKKINYIQDELELMVQSVSRDMDSLKLTVSELRKKVAALEKKHS
jgi:polyhydroxyalkanoate synthesis regulator phasin|tara:strand:+ start:1411 stop:1602 length:192 start_codon:yes stop_codon:yes gene_type:complete